MEKMLIAIDGSASAMKAVEYVGRHYAGAGDIEVGLVNVLPNLPAIFWDEGHILSDEEKRDRKKVVDKWLASEKAKMEPIFRKAIELLTGKGIEASHIRTKSISDSTDVAESILEEAHDAGYQTIVMGRCDRSAKHLLGSVASRIINHASGVAVTVVE